MGAGAADGMADEGGGGAAAAAAAAAGNGVGAWGAAEARSRWAEALVFELLLRDAGVVAEGWAVEWVSARPEMRTAPFDILMTRRECWRNE